MLTWPHLEGQGLAHSSFALRLNKTSGLDSKLLSKGSGCLPWWHSHRQCVRVPISPHASHLLFSSFLKTAIPVGVKWYPLWF